MGFYFHDLQNTRQKRSKAEKIVYGLRRHHKREGRYVSIIEILVTDEEKQVFIGTKKLNSEICLKVLVKQTCVESWLR